VQSVSRQLRDRRRGHGRRAPQARPGEPNNTDLYTYSPEQIKKAGIGILPQTLGEAIDAFEADDVVRGALGDALAQEFIALKRMEWTEYSRSVSGWETDRYLEMF
jgi:glutamine synthetase